MNPICPNQDLALVERFVGRCDNHPIISNLNPFNTFLGEDFCLVFDVFVQHLKNGLAIQKCDRITVPGWN